MQNQREFSKSHQPLNIMKKIPSERTVLKTIYEIYYTDYVQKKATNRLGEIFVNIDVSMVADELAVDKHLLFGYLRHLDRKYVMKSKPHVAEAHLFAIKVGEFRHAVDFPYLAAILAAFEEEERKFNWTRGLSVLALIISIAALIVTAASKGDHGGASSFHIDNAQIEHAVVSDRSLPKPQP